VVSCVFQMTKKIKKLEKETAMYRQRWESSNKALLSMAEEVSDMWLSVADMIVPVVTVAVTADM